MEKRSRVRAAFKAIDAGYQVAVLVPTTVLAEQHGPNVSRADGRVPVQDRRAEPLLFGPRKNGRFWKDWPTDRSSWSLARTGWRKPISSSIIWGCW